MSATEIVWPEAAEALREDPAFGPLVRKVGPVRMEVLSGTHFEGLVRSIVYQQLAGAAAATIHGRVREALDGRVTPATVLAASEEALRGAGLSASKLRAIRELAAAVEEGTLPLDELPEMPNQEVERHLTGVWGIGAWTAHMFLLFRLRRPDIWPVGDLGVRKGWALVQGSSEAPDAGELAPLGEPYRPWRSAVAWYCWRAADTATPD